eukprot:TRINITY_DN34141_c0_g1_i1.p1 TRINITY_DN34141_c0_g1~~TRINITY_DN34141_c0_g1_i1.p1  ORF type:complete len:267 (+),score=22.81 TRINITY_DN34141_c0_g1_i1:44-844(+)
MGVEEVSQASAPPPAPGPASQPVAYMQDPQVQPMPHYGAPGTSQPAVAVPMVVGRAGRLDMWNDDLFANCNCEPLCCNVYWCGPCMTGRNQGAIEQNAPDHMDCTSCGLIVGAGIVGEGARIALELSLDIALPQVGGSLMWLLTACYTQRHRSSLRRRYGIQGEECGDCVTSWFCTPCAICQHHSEITRRGTSPGYMCCHPNPSQHNVVAVQATQPAYVANQGQAPPYQPYPVQGGCAQVGYPAAPLQQQPVGYYPQAAQVQQPAV